MKFWEVLYDFDTLHHGSSSLLSQSNLENAHLPTKEQIGFHPLAPRTFTGIIISERQTNNPSLLSKKEVKKMVRYNVKGMEGGHFNGFMTLTPMS